MDYLKSIAYLCLAVFKTLSTNAALLNGSPAKILEDIAEAPRYQTPISTQYDLVSHANIDPRKEKQSQVDLQVNFLVSNAEITPVSISNKRNFDEALKNEEAGSMKSPESVKKKKTPQLSSDWGDDLLFFTTEWDVFPNYSMESHYAEIDYDVATEFGGLEHRYQDYYDLQKIFEPASLESLSRINLCGASETQVTKHQNLGEMSFTLNLPHNSLTGTKPRAGLAVNSDCTLAGNYRLTHQGEAGELNREGQSEMFKNPQTFHFNRDPDNKRKTRTEKIKSKKNRKLNVKILEKHGMENSSKAKGLSQSSKSSSKVFEQNTGKIQIKATNERSKVKGKKLETISGQEKSLEDILDEFKLQLEDLRRSSSTETELSLFLKTIDSYADNKSANLDLKKKKKLNQENLNIFFRRPFIKSFLSCSEIPIGRSIFFKLHDAYKKRNDKGGKYSNDVFFKLINDQVNVNSGESFYVLDSQVKSFFGFKYSDFKVKSPYLEKASTIKNNNYYADQLAKTFGKSIKFIPWEVVFPAKDKIKLFQKRETIMKSKGIGKFVANYGILPTQRFNLRKLFLVYSTLINKVFCSGEKDLEENFLDRQEAAMDFFDEIMSLLETDNDSPPTYFIRTENFPLDKVSSSMLINKLTFFFQQDRFQFKIPGRNRSKIDVIWKFLALWLAKEKHIYFKQIYHHKSLVLLRLKNFFNSLFFYIVES
ncbi:hypothetical protein PPACK8108_LOCUS9263 [Phakopsora pachyrhizi]|uniref:Uncharacterized protein n=1 Tax=Phakopsora pachyrhizi TaxID=170000 RepID=A0AAV0AZN4_PHAPC|nr:hypothetical protein PPACK8108_LOCUS9263 [Phakopsora pachyrhizi]